MNKVILMGRLTRDPEVRYSTGAEPIAVARYTLAVDRRARDGKQSADFIPCVAFGKSGEFAEKYLRQGMKIAIAGRIQTGSYTNREGKKVYTTEVVVEEQEFAESKREHGEYQVQFPLFQKQRGILWANNVCRLRANFRSDEKNAKVLRGLQGVDITPEVPE